MIVVPVFALRHPTLGAVNTIMLIHGDDSFACGNM